MSAPPPRRQRAEGRVSVAVERAGAASVVTRIAESGSARVRFPRVFHAVPEGVLINTAGGIASGDRFAVSAELGPGAALVLTTAAAEKVYRSDGDVAAIDTRLVLGPGSALDWLPQETILFDRARLARSLTVEMAGDATAFLCEALVFGRAAHGETMTAGLIADRWRVRRAGRLVYADTFRLDGDIGARLARPAIGGGARAIATLLYVAPDAEARLEEARGLLDGSTCECGASAWNGLLALRFLAQDVETLRRDLARIMTGFRGRPLPRVWHL